MRVVFFDADGKQSCTQFYIAGTDRTVGDVTVKDFRNLWRGELSVNSSIEVYYWSYGNKVHTYFYYVDHDEDTVMVQCKYKLMYG